MQQRTTLIATQEPELCVAGCQQGAGEIGQFHRQRQLAARDLSTSQAEYRIGGRIQETDGVVRALMVGCRLTVCCLRDKKGDSQKVP